MHQGSRKAIVAALLANLGIAIAKLVGFIFTGAASMLAEAIHSVADTSNQALLIWGGREASRPESTEHQFGYSRVRYFWAFVVALILFSVGGLFAVYEGIDKIRHPHELDSPLWAVGILTVALVLESLSFRTAMREGRAVKGGRSWWAFIRHTKRPELPVVLLEDFGALIGLAIALGGVGLATFTGDPRFDAVGSLAIGVLLVVVAFVLAAEMKSLLIGEAADPEVGLAIKQAAEAGDDVVRLIHMRTQHLGPDDLLVGAKLQFAPGLTTAQIAEAVDATEARIRQAAPGVRIIYLEPDLYREPSEMEGA
jgi:cation diffusion facilitator family transporter